MTADFTAFLAEGDYLRGWSPKTLTAYRQAWHSYDTSGQPFTRDGLAAWIVALRQRGVRPASVNAYIRALNSYLSYLQREGHPCPPRLRQLREPARPPRTLPLVTLQAILKARPRTYYEWRLHALVVLLMDTGIRIEEALTLTVPNVDLDGLLLRVTGKGSRTRVTPCSVAGRKVLYRFLVERTKASVPGDVVLATREGQPWEYQNCRRDLLRAWPGVTPHMFRHTFATRFIASGGSPFQLQRILGHRSIQTTLRYVHLQTEDLSAAHRQHGGVGQVR